MCVNVSDLVIARLSHSLGKVAVHQRLVDKDGLIYSLESLAGKNKQENTEHAIAGFNTKYQKHHFCDTSYILKDF